VGPDGRIYRGNQFDQGESIPAATESDAVNNVEGVHLFEPGPGEYTIRIRARNVVEDARTDTPGIDQDFALVVSADLLPPGVSAIFMDRPSYTAPGRIRVTVIDTDLAGTPTLTVNVRSTIEPAGENVVLRASGNGGVFTNSIPTTTSAVAGQLQIAHGNTITATYQDVSAGITRTATATADLVPPVLTGVMATNRFGRTVIEWRSDELADSRVIYGTNSAPGQVASDSEYVVDHEISLIGLIPGRTYFFKVASTDRAGNASTNSNGGALYTFVAPAPPAVLLVDAFFDDLLIDPPPPIEGYTDALDAIGTSYDLWDVSIEGSPTLTDLRPYRTVIWRLPEFGLTLSADERSAITSYLNDGGSLFIASMEVLSRLDENGGMSFRQNVLQVPTFEVDPTVPAVDGVTGDPIGGGMSFELDYTLYDTFFGGDFSDTITPGTNATGILVDSFGDFAGLRYPRTGVDAPGRVVFLGFPFDTIPVSGPAPSTRAEFLRRILNFLAPGREGAGVVTFDRGFYTLPSTVTVEASDSDLVAAGQITVNVSNTRTGGSLTVQLQETVRLGTFRGTFTLDTTSGPGILAAAQGDQIVVTYFDVSRSLNVTATAVIDTEPPEIADVRHEPDYIDAFVSWTTSEPADALVQYGESVLLGRSVYSSELRFAHELRLTSLLPDHTYYYRVISRDEAGNTTIDPDDGTLYTFDTLRPIIPDWMDDLNAGATNWTVVDGEDTFGTWTLGVPNNGWETAANSPPNAWGSNLGGGVLDFAETFLISPAIHLTGGNRATLTYWQSYDMTEKSELDILELGRVLIITNTLVEPALLTEFGGDATRWEEVEIDLTPYVGNVVYIVFHYVMLSFDTFPRTGWLVDDVSVTMNTVVPGLVVITNNLFQARFTVTGERIRTGVGVNYVITNASPGSYTVTYQSVPSYTTPPPQTNTLSPGGTLTFTGNYTFADANSNGMSDAWETQQFGSVSPSRTAATDTDGDGMSDLQEFRAGMNPNSASSRFVIATPVVLPDGGLRLQWPSAAGRGYCVEGSTNGVHWAPVTQWMRAPGTLFTHDLPPRTPGAPYLFRIEVQP
jgi:hypothetical protein